MSDIYNILATNYSTVGTTPSIKGKYVAVDPKLYEGSWAGTYGDNSKFSFKITQVEGFRAKVQFNKAGSPPAYAQVLIRDNSFRIADTKFQLQSKGVAQIATAVSDSTTGTTNLFKAVAKKQA